ncbi:MAG TPA: bifunctional glutamate N-acetyltransferase/amino-acid acetyltransferase ArgJ [Defluviitoga sp.]|nr:bifunctional glutamate N-acetyltransferase/amino-acid acetyltransferase ArgJ [Defluviitoga sp.]HOP24020.1 bifunctional glutamate N-acetyltransferase/amino-acid acetyltransferase ArgJ [Defluviitoga sp.]HPZ29003.1 bifunctional glutamate N-acetyltransferase/amino-acid acetyltransferase ArgJ [Defluviitoga sp.]HQD62341.1 bifunctional glutamate N-acetyltransferase/amino-acid acetyltransferase ArgJ [Defluviitoga sp.]
MENLEVIEEIVSIPTGFKVTGIHAGIKKAKKDLGLIYSKSKANAAAVFTTNKVKAASVLLSMNNVINNEAQAIIVNSGNANACTGEKGYQDAVKIVEKTASILNLSFEDVLICSTGVIGVTLPLERILVGIEELYKNLDNNSNLEDFAYSIMTTDTFPKIYSKKVQINDRIITLTGVAKGSGMIHPNMATMLSFILTDANISKDALCSSLKRSVNKTYNMVSVDGDTSTNDTTIILANGEAKNDEIVQDTWQFDIFQSALDEVNTHLAKMIAMDGEGATKVIEIQVLNAISKEDANLIARSIAKSNLVKTAIFGQDANWGRIMAAAGYSGANFNPNKVDIWFISSKGKVQVCEDGHFIVFSEELAKHILSCKEIVIVLDLKEGNSQAIAWGCDLTYDYVKINGGYRS